MPHCQALFEIVSVASISNRLAGQRQNRGRADRSGLIGGCMGEIPLVGAPNSVPGGLDCVCVYIYIYVYI